MEAQKTSEKIGNKQKRLYVSVFIGAVVVVGGLVYFFGEQDGPKPRSSSKPQFDVVSNEVNPEDVRLASLETVSDILKMNKSFRLKPPSSILRRRNPSLKGTSKSSNKKLKSSERRSKYSKRVSAVKLGSRLLPS